MTYFHPKRIVSNTLVVALFAGANALSARAQNVDADLAVWMEKNKAECLQQASVLSDARWNKWKKSPSYSPEKLTDSDYKIVMKVAQQQCISVRNVVMLRQLKSRISSEDAGKMEIDRSIEEQMLIIEKTL